MPDLLEISEAQRESSTSTVSEYTTALDSALLVTGAVTAYKDWQSDRDSIDRVSTASSRKRNMTLRCAA